MGSGKSSSSKTYYGTILYGIALGRIKLVHCIKVDSATVWKDQDGIEITSEYKDFDTDAGTCRIYKGSWTQTPDSDSNFSDGPAYRGLAYMRWHNLTLGSEKTSTPSIEVECTWEDADENGLVEADENGLVSAVACLQELYTDSRIGIGAEDGRFSYGDAVIEDTVKVAPKIDSETSLQDFCDDLLPCVWCYARFSGRTLDIQSIYDSPDWDSDSIPALDEDNCVELSTITPETVEERVVQTVIRWTEIYDGDEGDDTEGEYDNVSIYRDASVPEAGGKSVTVQAAHIITSDVADEFAIAKGHQEALSITTVKAVFAKSLYTYAQTAYMMPVKVFDKISQTWIRARVTSRDIHYNEDVIEIEAETDYTCSIHDEAFAGYEAPTFSTLEPVDPRAVSIVELPRPLAGQTAVGILCARGSEVVNGFIAYISVDQGTNFTYVDNFSAFAVYGTLESAITVSDGTAVVADVTIDADALDSVSSAQAEADTILGFVGTPPNHEIISVSTITQGTEQLTVSLLRGRLGTIATAHEAGEPVYLIRKANLPIVTDPLSDPSTIIDTALYPDIYMPYFFHLPQRVVLNFQNEDDCEDIEAQVVGEYARPLPPKLNLSSLTDWDGSSDIVTATPQLWRDEGYPSADFYEVDDVQIVPVVVDYAGTRHVLDPMDAGDTTITAAQITGILGDADGYFTLEIFTYYRDRHSKIGTQLYVEQAALVRDTDGSIVYDTDGTPLKDVA